MNKALFTLILLFSGVYASAQVNPHAIGIRGGSGNFGLGGEISYQHGLGDAHRIELDFGARGNNRDYQHVAVTAIYHWVWNITEGLNWYIGPGAQVGLYNDRLDRNDGITLGVGGQIGIEYDLNQHNLPLLIGLDTRPMFGFNGGTSGIGYGGAFSLRYTF